MTPQPSPSWVHAPGCFIIKLYSKGTSTSQNHREPLELGVGNIVVPQCAFQHRMANRILIYQKFQQRLLIVLVQHSMMENLICRF